jgi:hypothetical protein
VRPYAAGVLGCPPDELDTQLDALQAKAKAAHATLRVDAARPRPRPHRPLRLSRTTTAARPCLPALVAGSERAAELDNSSSSGTPSAWAVWAAWPIGSGRGGLEQLARDLSAPAYSRASESRYGPGRNPLRTSPAY